MERNSTSPSPKIFSPKNLLIIWALSLTLTANSPKVFAQKEETQQELINNVDGESQNVQDNQEKEKEKMYFINNFAHVLNYVKDVKDLPYNPRYKNPQLAEKHNFPNKVDIDPKIIDKPKSSISIILWGKKFEIVPFLGIKVLSREFKENKSLDDPKMILKLSNKFGPNTITMSCKEFAKYAYDFTQIPKGGKKIFFSSFFTVHEISSKESDSDKQLLTQNIHK